MRVWKGKKASSAGNPGIRHTDIIILLWHVVSCHFDFPQINFVKCECFISSQLGLPVTTSRMSSGSHVIHYCYVCSTVFYRCTYSLQ